MAPPAQALLTSLVANAAFGRQSSGMAAHSEAEKEKDEATTLEVCGVEIIVNESGDHRHAVYPHFDDRPEGCGHCHVSYPASDLSPGGLIGELAKDDAIVHDDGIEIIACDGSDHLPHAVYPHFGDWPDEGLIGESCGHAAKSAYRLFESNAEKLIGDDANNIITRDSGIEIITSYDGHGHPPHAVYPHFGDKPDEGLTSHAVFPSFGVNSGGLIGESCRHVTYPVFLCNAEKLIGDEANIVIQDSGIEIITSDDGNNHLPHVVYPHLRDRPDAVYPSFGVNLGGLIGENTKDNTIIENYGVDILVSDGLRGYHPHVAYMYPFFESGLEEGLLGAHAVYPALETTCESLIQENGAVIGHAGVEIIVSNASSGLHSHAEYPHLGQVPHTAAAVVYPSVGHGCDGLIGDKSLDRKNVDIIAHSSFKGMPNSSNSIDPGLGASLEELIGEKIQVASRRFPHRGEVPLKYEKQGAEIVPGDGEADHAILVEAEANVAECTTTIALPKDRGPPPNRLGSPWEMAWLVKAFLGLPRAQVLSAMRTAIVHTSQLEDTCEICTGCGTRDGQQKFEGCVWPSMLQLPIAAT